MKTAPIEEQYEKNKDLKKEDVEALMTWAEKQPHLPKITELDIILFLCSCYFNQEATKNTIDSYYTCMSQCDDIFAGWNPREERLRKAMDVMIIQHLSEPANDGSKIIFIKFIDSDASKFNPSEQMKIFCMSTILYLVQEGTAPSHAIVIDFSGFRSGHFFKVNIILLKKFFYFLQEAIPFRLKEIHFFDCTPLIDKCMLLIRPFLKDEVLFIHTQERREEFYKYVPQRCLPEEYGGRGPSVRELHEIMKNRLLDHADFLQEVERTQRVDEKLRPDQKSCTIS